ncbi:hypothetical protein [Ktedonospora formicarum]|uniref:Uncharacterized protein n=1 Tax=Ktedonospora formicarum TaxID=2778364 RepID=A0A8J3I2N0_9CHLR|nr:hypothetical protein [Ktedonospora formicarum]GHO48962.1 hypothetical protein KSX_71250 [Ktedonospora formicarum]
MKPDPYIRQGNIFFVPVLRHRLNFAVLVQQAFHELGLDHHDLIAVELPASAEKPLREALQRLPSISLAILSVSDSDQREVFPVTPADALIEGIRTAIDRDIPLAFIDQELTPGHLTDRICIEDAPWPDDALALKHGAEWYLDLVAGRLSHEPSRYEPVDSWRELHMARRLQQLFPFYQRILVISHAAHIRPIQHLLRLSPLSLDHSPLMASGAISYKIWSPSLPILISYLDYIPHLVELYEKQRGQGKAHLFDKRNALLELIYRLQEGAVDMDFSIRHYQAFTQMLTSMLEREGQISPRIETVMAACRSCFNKPFSERVYRHLLKYYDQVKVMRIGKLVDTKEPVYEVKYTDYKDMQRVFVARNCTELEQHFEILYIPGSEDHAGTKDGPNQPVDQPIRYTEIELDGPPPNRRNREKSPQEETVTTWIPRGYFEKEMRAKAFHLAVYSHREQIKSIEFRGALEAGIDFRRTLRTYWARRPKVYVKTRRKSLGKPVSRTEPIVWLFQKSTSTTKEVPHAEMHYTWCGEWHAPLIANLYVAEENHQDEKTVVFNGNNAQNMLLKVYREKILGMTSFVDDGLMLDDIIAAWGANYRERIPTEKEVEYLDGVGYTLHSETLNTIQNPNWWEYLIFGAIYYAKEIVLMVTSPDFTLPPYVVNYAQSKGKEIIHISLLRFTADEVRKLQALYWIKHKYPYKLNDTSDPEYVAYIVKHFSEIMKQFW